MLCSALSQITNRENAVYKSQRYERGAECVIAWMYVFVFAVCMDFTLIHSLSFIFFTWGTADEFQMLSGFMFLRDNCHPIITLTQVLIPNYKPVTKLIFSYCRRVHGAVQELRWILSPGFCAFFHLNVLHMLLPSFFLLQNMYNFMKRIFMLFLNL